ATVAPTWARGSQILRELGVDPALLERWLAAHDQYLGGLDIADYEATRLLLALRRPHEALSRFPEQRASCADALLQLGEYRRVLDEYPEQPAVGSALWNLGRYTQALESPDPSGELLLWLYWTFGRLDEMQRVVLRPEQLGHRANILLGLDRPAEVLVDERAGGFERDRANLALGNLDACLAGSHRTVVATAMLLRGRASEVEARWPSDWKIVGLVRGYQAMDRLAGGDRTAMADLVPPCATWFDFGPDYARWQLLLVPFLRELQGDEGAFVRACQSARDTCAERYAQVVWHDARYLLGEIDADAWRAQPMRAHLDRRLALLDALLAERAGRTEEALACYRRWLGPHPFGNDPIHLRFAQWRIAQLGG
ncbi:MAG: hypothetical protein H0W72_16470, partial [Planctomycetes bacterium]|nr:hypothetical protein [Planctomycetota bacterium]